MAQNQRIDIHHAKAESDLKRSVINNIQCCVKYSVTRYTC